MRLLLCTWLCLISISSIAEIDNEPIAEKDALSAVEKIEELINSDGDEWSWVPEYDERYRQSYEKVKKEFFDYLRSNNPDLLMQIQDYGKDANIRIFLVFHERNTQQFRAGWYYYWAFPERDSGSCTAYRWDYDYSTFHENGDQVGGSGNAGKGGGCLH